MILDGKRIVLGVSGSVAAYKSAYIASALAAFGARVDTVMTAAAAEFIGRLTFEGLTRRPAYTSVMQMMPDGGIAHVELGDSADAIVVASATADTIARLAAGTANDILTATVLASKAPLIVAPAMESEMYLSDATRENLEKLKSRGATIVEPASGRLASGRVGPGRLADPEDIIAALRAVLGRNGPLKGRKILVTGGGTRSQIDPVRFIGNKSSGRQGIAIAEVARDRGACVTLILGHHSHASPAGVDVRSAPTYQAMRDAVIRESGDCDALIMAAAINDFEVARPSSKKTKRSGEGLKLDLVENPDFLLELGDDFVKVGFAAETEGLEENAEAKLVQKRLDAIVANNVTELGAGFDTETNHVNILRRGSEWEDIPMAPKELIAERIVDVVQELLENRPPRG